MDIPGIALLCLEQRDRSLKSHTMDFLELACQTHYPDLTLPVLHLNPQRAVQGTPPRERSLLQFCHIHGMSAGEQRLAIHHHHRGG